MFEIVVATDKAYRLEDRADLKKFKLWHPHVDPVKWTQSLWEKIHGRVFLKPLRAEKYRRNTLYQSTRRYRYHELTKRSHAMHIETKISTEFCHRWCSDVRRSIAPSRLPHRTQKYSRLRCSMWYVLSELDMSVWNWIMGDLYMRSVPNGASTIWS
jgi:hypothetical protein